MTKETVQPEQEPKSVTYKEVADSMNALRKGNFSQKAAAEELGKLKLYNTPPQRPWVDLTDEEIKRLWIQYRAALPRYLCFAKALLAKSKEKNNG
jgi:hypothetical protein